MSYAGCTRLIFYKLASAWRDFAPEGRAAKNHDSAAGRRGGTLRAALPRAAGGLRVWFWRYHAGYSRYNCQMPAPLQTPNPDLRDLLAAERTFLAWIRTGLALMGFGFVVARFGLFLQQLQLVQHVSAAPTYGLSLWFGTALIAVGVVVFVLSAWHHVRLVQELNRGGPVASRPSTQAVAIALFLALVGLAMAIYLISVHIHTIF